MGLNAMSALWARTALIWFATVVSLGLYMGINEQFQFAPAHAHIGVLGWLSSAAFAFLHSIAREVRPGSRAGLLHWAAHTLGTAMMTGGLFAALGLGYASLMELVRMGAILIVLSVFWAAIMFWPRLSPRTADPSARA
ncbi:hypothetical protein [Allosphingosinicella sp.]|uniref:hypothetical protein n=1 Tax=Allosphingosinicella sp. TaxID=2823234 RepID=UPI003D717EED